MLIADGFKLTGLEDKVAARCAGAKTVTETTGAGKLRSNTGSQAKWKPTEEGIGSITTTGYKFMDTNGNVTQLKCFDATKQVFCGPHQMFFSNFVSVSKCYRVLPNPYVSVRNTP